MEGKAKEEAGKGGVIDTWLRKHRLIYIGATRHPFILAIRDGTVNYSSFKKWLGQDYIFVREFVAFAASVLIKAWKESDDSEGDTEVILGGMAGLHDEIAWFKKEASKWGVELSETVPQKANQVYCRFLESLMSPEVDYTVAITVFWAIEAVYQESFAHCLEPDTNTPPELQEVCQRWGNDGFGQYCHSLKKIANRLLEKASDDLIMGKAGDDVLKKAEVELIRVLEHEVEFWNMSRGTA